MSLHLLKDYIDQEAKRMEFLVYTFTPQVQIHVGQTLNLITTPQFVMPAIDMNNDNFIVLTRIAVSAPPTTTAVIQTLSPSNLYVLPGVDISNGYYPPDGGGCFWQRFTGKVQFAAVQTGTNKTWFHYVYVRGYRSKADMPVWYGGEKK
jgi:hypothetical protein